MKKRLLTFFLLLGTFFIFDDVQASSFQPTILGDNQFSSEIVLTVQVNQLDGFTGGCGGLCGLVGDINYDKSKLTLLSVTGLNNFDLTLGPTTFVLYKPTGVNSGATLLQMKFKNTALADGETTSISISNISASDGDKDISASNISKTIKYVAPTPPKQPDSKPSTGGGNQTTKPTPDTPSKEETKSTNNYLSSITLNYGKITFLKDVLSYDLVVDSNLNSIIIDSVAEDTKAIITGNGTHSLKDGVNEIRLTVKAEDQTERIYTIRVMREKQTTTPDKDQNDPKKEEKEDNTFFVIALSTCGVLVAGITVFFIVKVQKKKTSE